MDVIQQASNIRELVLLMNPDHDKMFGWNFFYLLNSPNGTIEFRRGAASTSVFWMAMLCQMSRLSDIWDAPFRIRCDLAKSHPLKHLAVFLEPILGFDDWKVILLSFFQGELPTLDLSVSTYIEWHWKPSIDSIRFPLPTTNVRMHIQKGHRLWKLKRMQLLKWSNMIWYGNKWSWVRRLIIILHSSSRLDNFIPPTGLSLSFIFEW